MKQGSQHGVPQTKVVVEMAHGEVLVGTRSLLLAAGLPHYFWDTPRVVAAYSTT